MPNILREQARSLWQSRHRQMLAKYSVNSVVATATSQLVFIAVYALGLAASASSVIAFTAGAVPAYHLNRRWTWGRDGRSGWREEVAPYALVMGTSLVVVTLGTAAAERWIRTLALDRGVEVALVAVAFLAVNGVMFLGKYVVFDRLLFGREQSRVEADETPETERTATPPAAQRR